MTLIAVSKINKVCQIATDSRLTISNGVTIDYAIKLHELRVKISQCLDKDYSQKCTKENILYNQKWCLAYAGSSLTFSIIKDLLTYSLEYLEPKSNLYPNFFDDICKFILRIVKSIYQDTSALRDAGLVKFIIGGYDIIKKDYRLFEFSFNNNEDQIIEANYKELDFGKSKPLKLLGSGVDALAEVIEVMLDEIQNPYLFVKRFIEEKKCETVGGTVLYGRFDYVDNDFKIYNISQAHYENGKFVKFDENFLSLNVANELEDNFRVNKTSFLPLTKDNRIFLKT